MPYELWLPEWENHLIQAQPYRMIPSSANTPLVQDSWRHCLQEHPNQQLTQFFLKGISEGFRVGYGTQATSLKSSKRNLQSVLLHPEVIDNYIQNELSAHT